MKDYSISMNNEFWLSIFKYILYASVVLLAIGAIGAAIGTIGQNYFQKKIDIKKNNKIKALEGHVNKSEAIKKSKIFQPLNINDKNKIIKELLTLNKYLVSITFTGSNKNSANLAHELKDVFCKAGFALPKMRNNIAAGLSNSDIRIGYKNVLQKDVNLIEKSLKSFIDGSYLVIENIGEQDLNIEIKIQNLTPMFNEAGKVYFN